MDRRRKQATTRQRQYPVWLNLGVLYMVLFLATPVSAEIGHIGGDNGWPKEGGVTSSRAQHSLQLTGGRTLKTLDGKKNPETHLNRVAIIGGGIGGISVAHFLMNDDNQPNVTQLTIFEKEPQFGGRMHFTRIYGHGTTINTAGYTFDADDMLIEEMANFTSISLENWPHNGWNTESRSFLYYMSRLDGEMRSHYPTEGSQTNVGQSIDLRSRSADFDGMNVKLQKELSWNQHDRILTGLLGDLYDHEVFTTHLNSAVTRVTRHYNGTFGVYWAQTQHDGSEEMHMEYFDNVIIAAPFHQAALEIEPPLASEPEKIQYTPIHATIIISGRLPDSLLLQPYGKQWRTSAALLWPTHFRHQVRDRNAHGLPFISVFRDQAVCYEYESNPNDLTRVISGYLFSDDDIAALFHKRPENITFPDRSCFIPRQAHPDLVRPKYEIVREEFALEGGKVNISSGCVEWPTVAWIHRDYWPNGMPVIQRDGKGGDDEEWRELVPGMFYVNGFEGREGATVSKSIASGRKVKDLLVARYARG